VEEMTQQQLIKDLYKSKFKVSTRVTKVQLGKKSERMTKIFFVEAVKGLRQIIETSENLREDQGIDLVGIEDQYYSVITSLLRMSFSEAQIQLIDYYLFDMPIEDDFQGKIEVMKGKKTETYVFTTPEDLWDVLKVVK
jgi:hypothetical protein